MMEATGEQVMRRIWNVYCSIKSAKVRTVSGFRHDLVAAPYHKKQDLGHRAQKQLCSAEAHAFDVNYDHLSGTPVLTQLGLAMWMKCKHDPA